MNKEQIEAQFASGNIMAACLIFADFHKLPASEVLGFVEMALAAREEP